MWQPGQEVNKDVYAVNTGNIAAYVKENVSGVLNYTFESKVGTWDNKCLVLNDTTKTAIDGVTTNEAGGFLAWTSATTKGWSFDDGATQVKVGTDDANIKAGNNTIGATTYKFTYVKDGKTYVTAGDTLADDTEFLLVNDEGTDVQTAGTAGNLTLKEKDFMLELGEVASARQNEDPAVASRWTPSQSGVYIFRRSVKHDDPTPATHPEDDTFTYAGYYYDATTGKYYKIVLGEDPFRTYEVASTEAGKVNDVFDINAAQDKLGGTATVNRDGTINGTPKVWYVKEKTIEDTPVNFTYEEADTTNADPQKQHGPRLVVEYGAAINETSDTDVYDAVAAAARAQVDYINALGQYYQDKAKYEQALADYEYALALANAREALREKAQAMSDANAAVNDPTNGTDKKLDDKWDALKSEANGKGVASADSLKKDVADLGITGANGTDTTAKLSPDELLAAVKDATDDNITVLSIIQGDTNNRLTEVQKNYTEMKNLWSAIQDDITDINNALDQYTGDDPTMTPEDAEKYETIVDTKLKHLAKTLREYAQAYADLTADATLATYLDTADTTLTTGTKGVITGKAGAINADNNSDVTIDDDFNEAVQEYINAYNNNEAAGDALATAQANWDAAKTQYNKDVAAAKTAYEKVINQTAGKPQPGWDYANDTDTDFEYKDNSKQIVTAYSARRESQDAGVTSPFVVADDNATRSTEKSYNPQLNTNTGYLAFTSPAITLDNDYEYYKTLVNDGSNKGLPPDGTDVKAVAVSPDSATWDESAIYGAPFVSATDTIAALKTNLDNSTTDYESTKSAYETAKANAEAVSKVTIYVNLADDYADYWQYAGDTDQTGTTPTQNAEFYYRYLLQPGETSHKLIDSVELADTVTAKDYKNLTFDLNITLDSAQITYADDQRTITTEAVDSNSAFTLKVEDNNPESLDDQFNWVARDVTRDAIYKATIDGTTSTISAPTNEPTTVGGDTYTWKFTKDGATYVGNAETGEFYKVNGAGTALVDDSDATKVATVVKS